MKLALLVALLAAPLFAQQDRPTRLFPFDPGGPCSVVTPMVNNWTLGKIWTCVGASGVNNGTWLLVSQAIQTSSSLTDIRAFGATCLFNGVDQNTAVQLAIASLSSRIFIPRGCTWVVPSGIIPSGPNGAVTYYGEDWTTSVIKSNANPASTPLLAQPGVAIYTMNLQGNACTLIPNCQSQFYSNGRDQNDLIFINGYNSSNFAIGKAGTDTSGSNWRNYGIGDGIFTDTFGVGPGARMYNEAGSVGQALVFGNNGGSGDMFSSINPSHPGAPTGLHYRVFNDQGTVGGITEVDTFYGDHMITGHVAESGSNFTLSSGANENIDIGHTGFMRVTTAGGAFSIGGLINADRTNVMLAPTSADGRHLKIWNSSGQIMTIVNQDSGSTAVNRIFIPSGANYVCPHAFCIVSLFYDTGTAQWLLENSN